MLKDEFCTPEPARCIILRGAFCGLAFVSTQGDAADGVTTQVKVVKGLYTEVRNVQHVARGRVSTEFVLIDRESDG